MTQWRSRRGMILGFAILSAFIASLISYMMLAVVVSGSRQARYFRNRQISRYLAEAGLVWAQQQIAVNGAAAIGCFAASPDLNIDHDGNGATPVIPVDITAVPCPPARTQLTAVVLWR
jgi:hypothetical protein